jgi:lipid-A-disaccharide synthase
MTRIVISVQEASGDRIGAEILACLVRRLQVEVIGLLGPRLRAAGARPAPGTRPMNPVMGVVEVLRHLGEIRANAVALRRAIDAHPDLLVVIDGPDFNLPLARYAKSRGVPVLGVVSPQIWAWRRGRAASIARALDVLICLFPFEPALYAPHGLDARFIGHPLIDRIGASVREPGVVALFPGSRRAELGRLLRPFLAAVGPLGAREVLLPLAGTVARTDLGDLPPGVRVTTSEDALARAERALSKSGTSTLELALAGVPTVVAHRVHPLTYGLGRLLVRGVRHLALPNILLGRNAIPEYVQYFESEQLTHALRAVGPPPEAELRAMLGLPGFAERAAAVVEELLGRRSMD